MEYKEKEKNEKNNKEKAYNNNQELLKRNKEKNNFKFNNNINAKNSNTIYLKSKSLLMYQSKLFFKLITYFHLIKLYIIIFMNRLSISFEFNKRNFLLKTSEVTLKIKDIGNIQILSAEFFQKHNKCSIYINDNLQTTTKNKYGLTLQESGINTVRIIWNVKINSTYSMFAECNKIVEINLSKFDTTCVTTMNKMFYNCLALTSINFSNIDTSKVSVFTDVFSSCVSLISLDLSSFITKKYNIFAGMFSSCSNLEYVNFKLFDSRNYNFADAMFRDSAEKLIVCSKNEDGLLSRFLSKMKELKCNNYNYNSNYINKCYSKETKFESIYICDICGKNYVRKKMPQIIIFI